MNKKSLSTFVAAACVATAIAIPALPVPASWTSRPDEEESRAKLLAIGRALQLYREEYPPLPVAQRRTFSDAGLPPDISFLARPGHRWSLSGGMKAFQLSRPADDVRPLEVHFAQAYWSRVHFPAFGDQSRLFAARGEKLIVLSDPNVDPGYFEGSSEVVRVLVLRLDGTVEPVTFRRDDREWWRHK